MKSPQHILVIQTSFIGDVILATSLLETMHRALPKAIISILVKKGNESLFDNHPFVHKTIVWDKQKKKYQSLFRAIVKVRSQKFDLVINVHRFISSGIITLMSGSEKTVGFRKNPLSFGFSHRVEHKFGGLHEIERNHSLLKPILNSSAVSKPKLYPSKDDYEVIKKFQDKPYFTIAPTSVWFTKQWPADKWNELMNTLPKESHIYLLGAKADKGKISELAASHNSRVINLAGELSLLQSAALMQGAKMNYVNDSAPMHLCSAMNAPVRVVYCSTVPEFGFGPLSDNSASIETRVSMDCRPCGIHGHATCPNSHFNCANSIEIEQLLD